MLKINLATECYSCGACVKVCPVQCIHLEEDDRGFLKPHIEKDKCIDCGLCEKKCIASYKNEHTEIHAMKTMYGYNLDKEKRNGGASGGVFFELATACLKKGYLVAGCIWDENWNPIHVLTENMETVKKMQRSKYAQSNVSGVFAPIKEALKGGKKVLFSGTPCQIAAVRKYVGKTDGLFCVGLICHGVASRKVWRMYLETLRKQHGEITNVRMREKSGIPWSKLSLFFEFADGKQIVLSKPENGQFMQCFQECVYISERCLSCQYKGDAIEADIILGDGWGQNAIVKSMEDGKGMSCILVKTEKGLEFWDEISGNFFTREATADLVAQGNNRIVTASKKNPLTNKFYNEVERKGIVDAELLKKYMYINTPTAKIKKVIRKLIGRLS